MVEDKEKLSTHQDVAAASPGKIEGWLRERYELDGLLYFIKKKEVPLHRHSLWYYLGGMTLFFFIVQVITGILLLLYYRPTAAAAFESVKFIMTEVRFGWLIRSMHSWSANLMIAAAFIHMFSAFFLRGYRKPRELTWVSGSLLLFIALGFGFSGYLLPWNQLAYFATKVGTEIVSVVPFVGEFLLKFLRGGEDVTGATLTRFFGIHVAVLPMIIAAVLVFHLLLVQKQGMSIPIGVEKKGGNRLRRMPFFPNFLLRDLLGWVVALALLVAVAAIFPWDLGVKADPFSSAPAGIRPEWFFVFMFQTLKYIPAKILSFDGEVLGVLAFALGGALLVAVPFLDRKASEGKVSKLFTIVGVIVVLYILVMTIVAYTVSQTF